MTNVYIIKVADEVAENSTLVLVKGSKELFEALKLLDTSINYELLEVSNLGKVMDAQELIAELIDEQKPNNMDFN